MSELGKILYEAVRSLRDNTLPPWSDVGDEDREEWTNDALDIARQLSAQLLAESGRLLGETVALLEEDRDTWKARAVHAEGWASVEEHDNAARAAHGGPLTDLYVIQDTRQIVGNTPLFWMPKGAGYGSVIREVGRYTKAEAERMRDTDKPIPLAIAVACARPRIDMQLLRRALDGEDVSRG